MAFESTFTLRLSRDQLLRYYGGQGNAVQVRDDSGRLVRFPAASLRPFVDNNGIRGRFRIRFDQDHRLIGLERIDA